jgi:hypothetical protein
MQDLLTVPDWNTVRRRHEQTIDLTLWALAS